CVGSTCVAFGDRCADDFDCPTDSGQYCEPVVAACLPLPPGRLCEVSPDFDEVALNDDWHWKGVTVDGELFANVYDPLVVGDVSGDGVPDVIAHVYSGTDWT